MFNLTKDKEEHALALYRKSIVIDCHQDSALSRGYLLKMLNAGVTAANLPGANLDKIAETYNVIEQNSDIIFGPISTVKDILRAKRERKIAAFMQCESNFPLNGNTDLLPLFHKLGLVQMQPTYNNRNAFADGCAERTNCGLSNLGIELVERMNKLNMIVDCSHVGIKTTLDVCEHAKFVSASHSNARAICDNVRNKTDEETKVIAEKDGVQGIVGFPTFVKWTKGEKGEWPTVKDVMDHVDYIANLVGIEHVGVGLDLVEGTDTLGPIAPGKGLGCWPKLYGKPGPDGFIRYTVGLDSISELPNLAKGLVARGYSDEEIQGVLGENWLRLFKRAWGE